MIREVERSQLSPHHVHTYIKLHYIYMHSRYIVGELGKKIYCEYDTELCRQINHR